MVLNVRWCGDIENCDICNKPIADIFIDGRTKQGPWGILCPECWKEDGVGRLGTGYCVMAEDNENYFYPEDIPEWEMEARIEWMEKVIKGTQ